MVDVKKSTNNIKFRRFLKKEYEFQNYVALCLKKPDTHTYYYGVQSSSKICIHKLNSKRF